MPQQKKRTHRYAASCKYSSHLCCIQIIYRPKYLSSVVPIKQSDSPSLSSHRKLTNLRMRNLPFKVTLLSCWKRKRGWSSSSLRTNPSARSPTTRPSAFQSSLCLPSPPNRSPRFTALLPQECRRRTSQSRPLPVPRCFPARPPPTASTPRWGSPTWSPPLKSLWSSWPKQTSRRLARCPTWTCPAPCTLKTGNHSTRRLITTRSPFAHLSSPAPRPALPTRLPSCSPTQKTTSSPAAGWFIGGAAAATSSRPIPWIPQPSSLFESPL